MKRWLPGLEILARYEAAWLPRDLVAGLVLTSMLVPVGIAYAAASGLPGIYGLYASITPLIAYALFGPSRILVLGPDSALAPVILAVIVQLAAGDQDRAVTVAALMALISGVIFMLIGMLRLGFVSELLSTPIRYGYMNGIAVIVLVSQLPKLLGLSIESRGTLPDIVQIGEAIYAGRPNWTATAVGVSTLVVILLLKPFKKVPGLLIAVVGATVAVGLLGLDRNVAVLGPLPQGLPSFVFPWIGLADLGEVIVATGAVAMIAFADTSVLSRTYAAKTKQQVDPNQEMFALGAANIAAGLFQGIPVSSSASRTPVADAAGARTQLTGVVGAVGVIVLLVAAPNLLQTLPGSALAAVVIAAAIGVFVVADLRRIFRVQQWEFWLSMACFAGVVTFGVIHGIGLAIVLAVIEFLWDGWRPHFAVLGRVDGLRGYHDLKRYPDARRIPGFVLFRWDAPLFFANAEQFSGRILDAIAESPTPVKRIIVAAEPVTSIDVTSADMLAALESRLRESGIDLRFAEMKDPVKDKLKRFELLDRFGTFYPTVGAAVDAYLEDHKVDWKP